MTGHDKLLGDNKPYNLYCVGLIMYYVRFSRKEGKNGMITSGINSKKFGVVAVISTISLMLMSIFNNPALGLWQPALGMMWENTSDNVTSSTLGFNNQTMTNGIQTQMVGNQTDAGRTLPQSTNSQSTSQLESEQSAITTPSSDNVTEQEAEVTDNIRMIATIINQDTALTGDAQVTVTFDNGMTFRTQNKTITAEDSVAFPMSLPKPQDSKTANICALIEGEENTCDGIALSPTEEKVYEIDLELVNFEQLEPLS